ncbi:hypothetical protein K440DRAFT_639877 [Wilcoxina mikolae CBS 423.85]|nr:hypothetical protein K440DRAFT_639877 [Wilcoxina mikolae CBS 423.85]
MHSLFSDPLPHFHRKPSQESSPPPSPTSYPASPQSHHVDTQLRNYSLSSSASTKPTPLVTDVIASRPRLLGRQETPPSPPNSVLIQEGEGISPATSSPGGIMNSQPVRRSLESSANSLKEKFTRVFRGSHKRGSSENSWSTGKGGYGKHKKDNSGSTNATANPLAHIHSASSKTSLQDELDSATGKQAFYNKSQGVSPVSLTNENYNRGGGRRSRRIMNGGEVRIEIIPQGGGVDEIKSGNSDGSMKYYDYYTRSKTSGPPSAHDDDSIPDIDDSNFSSQKFVPSLRPFMTLHTPVRDATSDTRSSSESRERRFLEDSVAHGFEGFHIGVTGDGAFCSTPEEIHPPRTDSDASLRPIDANSRKASSSVLNHSSQSDSNANRSHSSLARKNTGGSITRRPTLNRDLSSSSYIINGRTISAQSANPTEEVTRELRRLSKISAGSGVSGVAIVVTADGPASTKRSADSDEDDSYEGPRFTKEEKGKARAASSEPSGTHDQRSHTRSLSGHSEWTAGTERTHRSDDDSDSKSLLPAVPEIVQSRKLRAQEPSSDVLVHQGDPKYEFTYRMRQTPDDNPIFVPQYHYDAPLSFPNRNALGPPAVAKPPPRTADGTTFSSTSFANRMGGSILKRPPSALLRTDSPNSIPQGDYTFDSRPRTSPTEQHHSSMLVSKSHNDMDSLIHPALRDVPEISGKPREVVSMTSLEMFGNGFRNDRFSELGRGRDTRDSRDQDPVAEASTGRRVAYGNLLQPPPATHRRSSWDPARLSARLLHQFPARPKQFMRRSLTPHLYNPQDIALDDNRSDSEFHGGETDHHQRQQKIGRMLLASCLIFPPLWFVMACGGFDSFVATWTGGNVRGVGSTEKKIALVLATVVGLGAVIGVIVGVSMAATAGSAVA